MLAGLGKHEEALAEYDRLNVDDLSMWMEVKFRKIRILEKTARHKECLDLARGWLDKYDNLLSTCKVDKSGFLRIDERRTLNLRYFTVEMEQVKAILARVSEASAEG